MGDKDGIAQFDGIPFASLRSSDFVIRFEMPAPCLG